MINLNGVYNNMSFLKLKAFTLAEVITSLVVIGTISMILLPTLLNATPPVEEYKARKAYNTFFRTVEAVTAGSPYDLANGTLESTNFIFGSTDAKKKERLEFFCSAMADKLNTRDVDCSMDKVNTYVYTTNASCPSGFRVNDGSRKNICLNITTSNNTSVPQYDNLRTALDTTCNNFFNNSSASEYNLKTADETLWSIQRTNFTNESYGSINGVSFATFYNVVCMDVGKHKKIDYIYSFGISKEGNIIAGKKMQDLLDSVDEDLGD